jgi:protein N-terminal amidase
MDEPRRFSRMPNEPDMDALTYWVSRFEPLIRAEKDEETIVIFCNRTGSEDNATYAGTSAVLGIRAGEVKVYGLLGRGQKDLLVVDTSKAPYGKLVVDESEGCDSVGSEVEAERTTAASSVEFGPTSLGAYDTCIQAVVDLKDKIRRPERPIEKVLEGPEDFQLGSRSILTEKRTGTARQDVMQGPAPLKRSHLSSKAIVFDESEQITKHCEQEAIIATSACSMMSTARPTPLPASATQATSISRVPAVAPCAVRPKLIIPELHAPPVEQISPESASTVRRISSAKPVQLDKRLDANSSTRRAPEDSTPYPGRLGAPHGGRVRSFRQHKLMHGGSFNFRPEDFTPTTVFDDASPVSFEAYYRQQKLVSATPLSARSVLSRDRERQTTAFPWPRSVDCHNAEEKARNDTVQTSLASHHGQNSKDAHTAGSSLRPVETWESPTENHPSCQTQGANGFPLRPRSPKSRNASRSRLVRRSSSVPNALSSAGGPTNEVTSSVNSFQHTACPRASDIVRPSSCQQVASGKTPTEPDRKNSVYQGNVPIIACPSIFGRQSTGLGVKQTPIGLDRSDAMTPPLSTKGSPPLRIRSKKDSISPVESLTSCTSQSAKAQASDQANGAPVSVTSWSYLEAERSSSTDSTRNDILHHRVKRSSGGSNQSQSTSLERGRDRHRQNRGRRVQNETGQQNTDTASLGHTGKNAENMKMMISPCPSQSSKKRSASRQGSRPHPRYRSASRGCEKTQDYAATLAKSDRSETRRRGVSLERSIRFVSNDRL